MASRTLHIADLSVDGREIPGITRGGVLVTGSSGHAWRVHVQTTRNADWTVDAIHELEILAREGERVRGRALLRQSDGKGHLFIGEGEVHLLATE